MAHLCLCFLEALWDQVFLEVLGDLGDQPDLDHPTDKERTSIFEKSLIVASDLSSLKVTHIGTLLCLHTNHVSYSLHVL